MEWNTLASESAIAQASASLQEHGIQVVVVENKEQAKQKALELIPQGAEVMTMTSVTLDTVGVSEIFNTSGKYDAVKPKLMTMDRATQGKEMQKMGTAPEYAIGSVHAVTQDGHVLIASNTGSQLPAYVYGSEHVVWIVGAQKIVENVQQGMQRIEEYSLVKESERAHQAYGVERSYINKLLIINAEPVKGRTTLILVKELLGY